MTITQLVTEAQQGSRAAFGELYEHIAADLYRMALYTLGNQADAEDAVADTFAEAWKGIKNLREPEAFRSWMFRILSARCKRQIGRLGTGSFLWPVPGYSGISRWASLPYGHRGVDITAPYGTPIYAADAGTVIAAQWHNHPTMSWGYYVEIDHGNGYKTLYAHMSSFVVQAGQTVEKGQLIGYVGATGAATGPHCHFEMYYNNALISARNVFPDM